ncbi:response regulator [Azospirillum doebereinerae]|uniref:response regulator n=1 Tax=Azospirillum doebereinerae TaxID=92933 RepID=UPI001EE587C1|nr:response regulator [Azospirillum doebereinerae]MCG5244022.1 response regulator [Azospirillum doebereinerae]
MNASRQLLVVDDQAVNRLLVSRLLGKAGWSVLQMEGGEQALAWLAENAVELVLLDISMPTLSGQEVCRRIREGGLGGPGIRLVAYTAHAMPEEREQFLTGGFDAILVKPISRASLEGVLSELGLSGVKPLDGVEPL